MAQQIERRVVQFGRRDTQNVGAELFAQRPLVEHEPDVEGLCERCVYLVQLGFAKPVTDKRRVVDCRRVADGAVADSVADDFFDLCRSVAQFLKRCWHRLVDDLEVSAAGQFLEFDQCEVRLDPCGVAIHDQTDGACWCDHCGLSIAVAVFLAQAQGFVP